jgi:hypothetical protein
MSFWATRGRGLEITLGDHFTNRYRAVAGTQIRKLDGSYDKTTVRAVLAREWSMLRP